MFRVWRHINARTTVVKQLPRTAAADAGCSGYVLETIRRKRDRPANNCRVQNTNETRDNRRRLGRVATARRIRQTRRGASADPVDGDPEKWL